MRPSKKYLFILTASLLIAANSLFAADTAKAEQQRQAFITKAKEYIGVPYVSGGTDKSGFDCSGLVFTVGKEALNMDLPRTAAQMYDYVKIVADSKKEAGDLLFFKTVGDKISHVAIYIGNDQFIHAASDGPNTGVIISSLRESYWSKAYCAVGQLLPSTQSAKTAEADTSNVTGDDSKATAAASGSASSDEKSSVGGFFSSLTYNASAALNWSFLSPRGFKLNIRGATFDFCSIYPAANLKPGLALKVRWDPTMQIVQIPLVLSLSTSEHLRFYAGPVFTIGNPVLDDSGTAVTSSIFPGIIGFSWQSNSFEMFGLETRLVQDISYTIFNNAQGAALDPLNAIASGLYMTTGLRVTIPL